MKDLAYRFQVSSSTEGAEDNHIIFSGHITFGGELYCWKSSVPAARLRKVMEGDPLKPGEFQLVTESGTPIRQGKTLRVVLRQLAGPIIGSYWNNPRVFTRTGVQRPGPFEYTFCVVMEGGGQFEGQAAQEVQAAQEAFRRQLGCING